MKKVFCVISMARQVNGEMVWNKPEAAFTSAQKAEEFAKNLARQYTESIQTSQGPVECFCERGILEFEVKE